jgi:hypothetical protein
LQYNSIKQSRQETTKFEIYQRIREISFSHCAAKSQQMHFTWYNIAYSELRGRGINDEVALIKDFVGYEDAKAFHDNRYRVSSYTEFWKTFFVAMLGQSAYRDLKSNNPYGLMLKMCECCKNSVTTKFNRLKSLNICEKCEEPGKYYHFITQRAALGNYLLVNEDLTNLSHTYGRNRNFLEGEVLEAAYKKYGGPNGLEEALVARESMRRTRIELRATNKRRRDIQHEKGRENRAKTVTKAFAGSGLVYDGENLLLKTFIQEGPKAAGVAKVDELLRKFRLQTAHIGTSKAYVKGEILPDEANKSIREF